MKRLHLAFILPCVLISFSSVAEETSLKQQSQGDVTFISGGVGEDERSEMKAMRANYNLSLLFSVKGSGEYIGDAKVRIEDSSGNTALETVSDGPMLYAKLKPGHYKVIADRDGQIIDKKVKVGGKQLTSLSFAWPQEQGD